MVFEVSSSFLQSGSALQMEQNIRLKMLCWGTLNMLHGFAYSQLTDVILTKAFFFFFFAVDTSRLQVRVKKDTWELLWQVGLLYISQNMNQTSVYIRCFFQQMTLKSTRAISATPNQHEIHKAISFSQSRCNTEIVTNKNRAVWDGCTVNSSSVSHSHSETFIFPEMFNDKKTPENMGWWKIDDLWPAGHTEQSVLPSLHPVRIFPA